MAVGTTSARTLETAASSGILQPFQGETQLFIRPGHAFHGLDALITNFHLPRSSCWCWSAPWRESSSSAPRTPTRSRTATDSSATATMLIF